MSLSWYSGFTAPKGSEVGIQFRFPKTDLPSLVIVNYKLLGFWKNNQGSENKTVIVIFILFLFPQKLKLCPKVAAELNQQGRLSRGHIRNKQGGMKWSICVWPSFAIKYLRNKFICKWKSVFLFEGHEPFRSLLHLLASSKEQNR